MREKEIWKTIAQAIVATGTEWHVERLIDTICADMPFDIVTVARYSKSRAPEFVAHRNFSNQMIERYLSEYYIFDPFYQSWRRDGLLGVIPLQTLATSEVRRGRYIAEFLSQSRICDEIGVLLDDGGDWCLGIFLDRTEKRYSVRDVARLKARYAAITALQERDLQCREPGFARGLAGTETPHTEPVLSDHTWSDLTPREREVVQYILSGHPTATIAERMGITVGTTKNHRLKIYAKLDITSERELFLLYFHSNR